LIHQLFDEELARLLRQLPSDAPPAAAETLRQARRLSEEMILRGEFTPA
jgi:hypothetical protein